MSMPTVNTADAGMQAAANEFASKAEEFTNYLRGVNDDMQVLQSSWTGQASAKFNQAMDNWEQAFQSVINQLLNMLDMMGVTTKGYRSAEDDAAQTAESFASALPGV